MIKVIISLVFISSLFIGCGGSNDGSSVLNPFNLRTFDPYEDDGFKYEWHLKVVDPELNSHNIAYNSHINIYNAWEHTRGKGVKIAIIDYDFNPDNPDISSNVYLTYDVVSENSNVKKDLNDHGTSVAGIIAAKNNNYGTIGVAPESQLILIDANITVDWQRIKAFKKAKEFGADIVCCSWGFLYEEPSEELKSTIKDLHDSGITIIFSSGNNSIDLDSNNIYNDYSELPYVIGVGATNEYNKKAKYSNYGDNIDILAPGGSSNFGLYTIDYYRNTFHNFNGTSAAAPVIAGVAALMKSVNPRLTPDQIREILISTADKIEPNIAHYDKNGFSHTHAYGKVNASAAVAKAIRY